MLAVHWAPVSKTKTILKNGITRSGNGLYCFPLTGHKAIDRWWVTFFNYSTSRERKKYNGIVFRIKKADLPAYFGYWMGATTQDSYEKKITTLKELGAQFRETLLWRLGERIAWAQNLVLRSDIDYMKLAMEKIIKEPKALNELMMEPGFIHYSLEDHQIVLSHSIPADRIIKVLPKESEFGKVKRLRKKAEVLCRDHFLPDE